MPDTEGSTYGASGTSARADAGATAAAMAAGGGANICCGATACGVMAASGIVMPRPGRDGDGARGGGSGPGEAGAGVPGALHATAAEGREGVLTARLRARPAFTDASASATSRRRASARSPRNCVITLETSAVDAGRSASSALLMSSALPNRRAGSCDSARITASDTGFGTHGGRARGGWPAVIMCSVASWLSPS